MILKLQREEPVTAKPPRVLPTVLIKMLFEPLVMSKTLIETKIKEIFGRVESRAYALFPEAVADEILEKLMSLIASLSFTSQKKSVVIYLSGSIERVYYLNTIVEEDVSVGRPFTVKDIFRNEEFERKYLVLVASRESTRFYEGKSHELTLQAVNLPEQVAASSGYEPNNFKAQKDFLQQFMLHANGVLRILLQSSAMPFFVVATPEAKEVFSRLPFPAGNAIKYIDMESDFVQEEEIARIIKPVIDNWGLVRKKYIRQQIQWAEQLKKLVVGIEDVWKTARHSKCKQLVVEKNYFSPAFFDGNPTLSRAGMVTKSAVHIKDAVDDIIEQVLKDSGDIQFVDTGFLDQYKHIALIKY